MIPFLPSLPTYFKHILLKAPLKHAEWQPRLSPPQFPPLAAVSGWFIYEYSNASPIWHFLFLLISFGPLEHARLTHRRASRGLEWTWDFIINAKVLWVGLCTALLCSLCEQSDRDAGGTVQSAATLLLNLPTYVSRWTYSRYFHMFLEKHAGFGYSIFKFILVHRGNAVAALQRSDLVIGSTSHR